MSGFSFNGKHSDHFSLYHIPSAANRMLSMPDFELIESEPSGRDGGYYYGKRYKIREFSLECYFESIDHKTFEDMMQWLSPGTQGE